MTFFTEINMSFTINNTNTKFYSSQMVHVNPELCYFLLVIEEYYTEKYSKKIQYESVTLNQKEKRLSEDESLDLNDHGSRNTYEDTSQTNLLGNKTKKSDEVHSMNDDTQEDNLVNSLDRLEPKHHKVFNVSMTSLVESLYKL